MNIEKYIKESHDCFVDAGEYAEEKNIGDLLMRIIEELGAANAARREGRFAINMGNFEKYKNSGLYNQTEINIWFQKHIKDTFEDHIAMAFIRLSDLCGYLGIEVDELVLSSTPKITGSVGTDLTGMSYEISRNIQHGQEYHISENISFVFAYLIDFCQHHNIPIQKHIEARLAYLRSTL